MKKLYYNFLIAVVVLLQASCSPSLKVTSDYDRQANFSQYRSFSIDTVHMNQRISQLNQNRIVNAVKAELTNKGLLNIAKHRDGELGEVVFEVNNSVQVWKEKTSGPFPAVPFNFIPVKNLPTNNYYDTENDDETPF